MTVAVEKSKTFTGWHMLAIMVAFFGVVISVNMLMAYYANTSWSGILAKNTYVASQDFNAKAEEARGWAVRGFKGDFSVNGKRLASKVRSRRLPAWRRSRRSSTARSATSRISRLNSSRRARAFSRPITHSAVGNGLSTWPPSRRAG
jgi:nitrogen fixation protein FixH